MKPPRVCKRCHHCLHKIPPLWPHMLGLLGFIFGMLIAEAILMRGYYP